MSWQLCVCRAVEVAVTWRFVGVMATMCVGPWRLLSWEGLVVCRVRVLGVTKATFELGKLALGSRFSCRRQHRLLHTVSPAIGGPGVQPKVGGTIATMKVKACREVVDSFVCEGLGRRFEKGCVVEATFWAMNVDARGVGGSWRFHRGDLTAQKPPPCCEITGARS